MFVIVAGNPFDGLEIFGPFEDGNDAGDWAQEEINPEWWVVRLIAPETHSRVEIIRGDDLTKGDE